MSDRRGRAGFTLIEMLVVIAIILTLMALLVVLIKGMVEKARNAKTWSTIKMLDEACHTYKVDFGVWPPNGAGGNSKSLHMHLGRDRLLDAVIMNSGSSNGPKIKKGPLIEFNADTLNLGSASVGDPNSPVDVIDAWGNPIYYSGFPGTNNKKAVDIWSKGQDTAAGAPLDDINNWTKDY